MRMHMSGLQCVLLVAFIRYVSVGCTHEGEYGRYPSLQPFLSTNTCQVPRRSFTLHNHVYT